MTSGLGIVPTNIEHDGSQLRGRHVVLLCAHVQPLLAVQPICHRRQFRGRSQPVSRSIPLAQGSEYATIRPHHTAEGKRGKTGRDCSRGVEGRRVTAPAPPKYDQSLCHRSDTELKHLADRLCSHDTCRRGGTLTSCRRRGAGRAELCSVSRMSPRPFIYRGPARASGRGQRDYFRFRLAISGRICSVDATE